MIVDLSWSNFKNIITYKEKIRFIERSTDSGDFYLISYSDNGGTFQTSIFKDSGSDQTDFESNYKSYANNKSDEQKDPDGRLYSRPTAAKAGWVYFLCPIEFTTSKLNSIYCKKENDTSRTGVSYKIYDSNGTEITDSQNESNAVKTVVDFEPTHDYEIVGGQLQQHTKPTTNIRLWVIGVPDIAENYGGSKEMVGGVNLKFIDPTDKVHADGRVSKYMTYNATYHTNKLRLVLKHDAGMQHEVMMILEMYRA
jgi:hypothetical protein